ncbi:MAG TPA: glycosyltransferase family 4 protein [Solirubrobacteraceae bacterium]|nr:glycosyltransferase family 4 protein [Solirubrobacteraceae bacterium]
MRALVVSNMLPDAVHPERGSFVRDQVAALRALDGVDVELYEFPPGAGALAGAARELRRRFTARRPGADRASRVAFDVVHAHFGLTAWPARVVPTGVRALTLHGTDLSHPRTRLLTCAALPGIDLLATVSSALLAQLPPRAAQRAQVLPCGVDLERFRPITRQQARAELGLDAARPSVLFAADPSRPEKRFDRARELIAPLDAELLTLGGVAPAHVPLWINAADAVLVPSDREGFGLAVLEALACDVPVLATPVGIHEEALAGLAGALCAPFDPSHWRAVLQPLLGAAERPGTGRLSGGRARAERWSAARMAERVLAAWCACRGARRVA